MLLQNVADIIFFECQNRIVSIKEVTSGGVQKMSTNFVQKIIGTVIIFGLLLMMGCSTTKPTNKPTNVFSWPKVTQKQEERAQQTSMQEVLRQERIQAHP